MTSPRFQVLVNGELITTCGMDSTGGIRVVTTWKQCDRENIAQRFKKLSEDLLRPLLEPQINISVCGIQDSTKELLVWFRRILDVGDEISIRILPPDCKADLPVERRPTGEPIYGDDGDHSESNADE